MSLLIETRHIGRLPHYGSRPAGIAVDTVVLHSMYHPEHPEPCSPAACIARLDEFAVSAHYLIDQAGAVLALVPEASRAWHAGLSRMPFPDDSRSDVNGFSIGIELLGKSDDGFSAAQYESLAQLLVDIGTRHPLRNLVGHNHIAPGRKDDPGPAFKWRALCDRCRELAGSRSWDLRCPAL